VRKRGKKKEGGGRKESLSISSFIPIISHDSDRKGGGEGKTEQVPTNSRRTLEAEKEEEKGGERKRKRKRGD